MGTYAAPAGSRPGTAEGRRAKPLPGARTFGRGSVPGDGEKPGGGARLKSAFAQLNRSQRPHRPHVAPPTTPISMPLNARLEEIIQNANLAAAGIESGLEKERRRESELQREMRRLASFCIEHYGSITRAFTAMDANFSGKLSKQEFQTAICSALGFCEHDLAARLFAQMDCDRYGDGRAMITLEEWTLALQHAADDPTALRTSSSPENADNADSTALRGRGSSWGMEQMWPNHPPAMGLPRVSKAR